MKLSKKFCLLLGTLLALGGMGGCATTGSGMHETVWPSINTHDGALLTAWMTGDLASLDDVPQGDDPLLQLLAANAAVSRYDWSAAVARYIGFVETNPDHPYLTPVLIRLHAALRSTSYAFDTERILALRTQDPLAASWLASLQGDTLEFDIARRTPDVPPHPTALPLTQWTWLGPFTPLLLTEFDHPIPEDADALLSDKTVSNDPSKAPYRYRSRHGTTFLGFMAGQYAAQTYVTLQAPATLTLVVRSTHMFTLSVDGQTVLSKGRTQIQSGDLTATQLQLTEGTHALRLKFGFLESTPQDDAIKIWLVPNQAQDLTTIAETQSPSVTGRLIQATPLDTGYAGVNIETAATDPLKTWVLATMAIMNRDFATTDAVLQKRLTLAPNDQQAAYLMAERLLRDAELDPSARVDEALSILQSISQAAPQLAQAHLHRAFLLKQKGYAQQALDLLDSQRQAINPDNADVQRLMSDLFRSKDWPEDARWALMQAYRLNPDACALSAQYLENAALFANLPAPAEISQSVRLCPQVLQVYRQNAMLNASRQSVATALSERFPDHPSFQFERILTLAADNPAAAIQDTQAFLAAHKRGQHELPSIEQLLTLVDSLRANNHENAARQIVRQILDVSPEASSLHQMAWYLDNVRPMEAFRQDGLQIIRDYVDTAPTENASAVVVLDYAAAQYFENGSAIHLTHTITRVINKDGKNSVGEVYLPTNAAVLALRTVKQGSYDVVEPELIDFKSSISAPDLEVGDFVEVEYLTFKTPGFPIEPSRFSDMRFFFGENQTPIVRSEYIFEYPKTWKVTTILNSTPEIDVTPQCVTLNNRIRCQTTALNTQPFIPEPSGPPIDDLVANIQYLHNYDWHHIQRLMAHQVAAKVQPSLYVDRFLETIPRSQSQTTRQRAEQIYYAVIDAIDDTDNDYFGISASHTITRQTGSRMSALKALYDADGIPNDMALLRHISAPENMTWPIQSFLKYHVPVLVVMTETGPAYADPSEDFTPFDFLSPDVQGLTVIPLNPDRSPFVSRVDSFDAIVSNIEIAFDINPDGSAQGKGTEKLQSERAMQMRNIVMRTKNDEPLLKQVVERSLARSYGRIQLNSFTHENLDQRSKPLHIAYSFDVASFATTSNNNLQIQTQSFAYALTSRLAPLSTRKTPLILQDSIIVRRTLTFQAPEHYSFNPTQNTTLDTRFGRYERRVTAQGQTLTIQEIIDIRPQRISTEDYADFRAFCLEIDRTQSAQITATARQ